MLKKIVIILIIVSLFPLPVMASDSWSKSEILKQGLYGVITALDAGQTAYGIESGNFREANPVLGEHPSREETNQYLLSVFIAHTLIANYLSTENRGMFQDVSLIIGVTNISRNRMIGAKINF